MHLCRVLADHDDGRTGLDERPWRVGVLPEGGRAEREHDVVGRQGRTQPGAVGREVARKQTVILRESRPAAEGLLPDRAREPLCERDHRLPGFVVVDSGSDDERRPLGPVEERGDLCDEPVVGAAGANDAPGSGVFVRRRGFGSPVVHGHDDECRSAPRDRLVMGAGDRAGHALRAGRLIDPHRVVTRKPVEPSGEERLRREVATVLLADQDDEGRPVDARGGQRAHRVAEAGGRVQDRERGLAPSERPAGGHPHHRALVETEHEPEVTRQVGEQ